MPMPSCRRSLPVRARAAQRNRRLLGQEGLGGTGFLGLLVAPRRWGRWLVVTGCLRVRIIRQCDRTRIVPAGELHQSLDPAVDGGMSVEDVGKSLARIVDAH